MKYTVQEGSHSVADAVALCRPEVIASNPLIPQTHIIERLASLVAAGKLDAEFINTESHISALSIVAGSTACGLRSFTATSSQGLALMHEVLHAVSGMRLPVVMTVANRALSAPLNIWNDHSDAMSQRDTSWLQFYAETVQEVVDLHIQAYRIAESRKVMLPAMVCMDGYSLTHAYDPIDLPEQNAVDNFLPPFNPEFRLDVDNPATFGILATPDDYMEFKYEQQKAMEVALKEIKKVNREYSKKFGRVYGDGLIEVSNDADIALIASGSICGTIKDAIDEECCLIRIRSYRPFPSEELRKAVKGLRAVGVIDRAFSYGMGGQLYSEVKSIVDIPVKGFVAGLGGRDVTVDDVRNMITEVENFADSGEEKGEIVWVNIKI
jgi:pyruvate ferredoxin oxidoreductase alpha subunit